MPIGINKVSRNSQIGSVIPDGAIYYEGDTFTDKTGGWNQYNGNAIHTWALESDHILTQGASSNGRTFAYTENQIDLSNTSTIRVEQSMPRRGDDLGLAQAGVFVSDGLTENDRIFDVPTKNRYDANNGSWPSDYSRTEFTLDVSSIGSSRHVAVYGGTSSSAQTGTTEVNTFSVILD